jgi:AraC-like DNA-binding protein
LIIIGTFQLKIQHFIFDFTGPYKGLLIFNIVFIYLYFKSIVLDTAVFNKKDLFHLIAPTIFFIYLILIFKLNIQTALSIRTINFILLSLYSIYYFLKSFKILNKNIWKSNLQLNSEHFKLIRNWTIFLFSLVFLLVIRLITSFSIDYYNETLISGKPIFILHTLIWLIVFIKILISPEILFGLPKLNKKINSLKNKSVILHPIWKIQNDDILNYQDAKMTDKMNPRILDLIKEIEYIAYNDHYFRNQNITITDFANEMGIPISHLIYLFKYHCRLTFTEYKTIMKIEDAKQLIQNGFLAQNTLESLATEVGFSSYNPFFSAFKKIENMSPNEYANSCVKNDALLN